MGTAYLYPAVLWFPQGEVLDSHTRVVNLEAFKVITPISRLLRFSFGFVNAAHGFHHQVHQIGLDLSVTTFIGDGLTKQRSNRFAAVRDRNGA